MRYSCFLSAATAFLLLLVLPVAWQTATLHSQDAETERLEIGVEYRWQWLRYSDDGKWIALHDSNEPYAHGQHVVVVEASTGKSVTLPSSGNVMHAGWLSDNRLAVVAGTKVTTYRTDGTVISQAECGPKIKYAAVAGDVVAVGADSTVKVYDDGLVELMSLAAYPGTPVALSDDGKRVAYCAGNGRITNVHDVVANRVVRTFSGLKGRANLALYEAGRYLVATDEVYDVNSGKQANIRLPDARHRVLRSFDGGHYVLGGSTLSLVDDKFRMRFCWQAGPATEVSPDCARLATPSFSKIRFQQLPPAEQAVKGAPPTEIESTSSVVPIGGKYVLGSAGPRLVLSDPKSGKTKKSFEWNREIPEFTVSNDGSMVILASREGQAAILKTSSLSRPTEVNLGNYNFACGVSDDGKLVACLGRDGVFSVEVDSGKRTRLDARGAPGQRGTVDSVRFSPDKKWAVGWQGRNLAMGATAKLYDLSNGTVAATLGFDRVLDARFVDDSSVRLITTTDTQTTRTVWNVDGSNEKHKLYDEPLWAISDDLQTGLLRAQSTGLLNAVDIGSATALRVLPYVQVPVPALTPDGKYAIINSSVFPVR